MTQSYSQLVPGGNRFLSSVTLTRVTRKLLRLILLLLQESSWITISLSLNIFHTSINCLLRFLHYNRARIFHLT